MLSIDNRCSWYVDFLTCFADPIQITVQFMLELLLSSQFQEGLPVLHLFSLLRKLSTSVTQMIGAYYMGDSDLYFFALLVARDSLASRYSIRSHVTLL